MTKRKWLFGLTIAIVTGSLGGLSMLGAREGKINWIVVLSVLAGTILKDLTLWKQQHPVESIEDTEINRFRKDGGFITPRWLAVLGWIVIVGGLVWFAVGCASFSTTQTDERTNETTGEKTTVTTRAKSRTFFDSKSKLADFKATQTEKSQSASVGSLSQESSGSNTVNLIEAASRGAAQGTVNALKGK